MQNDEVSRGVEAYCTRLRKGLKGVPASDAEDVMAELRGHIMERIDELGEPDPEDVEGILRALGDPEDLAAEYRTQALLRHAAKSRSPLVLMKATLRWATTGFGGLISFGVTLFGYGCAAVFYLSALLEPILPSRIGLWLGPRETLTFGYWNGRLVGTEVYGIAVRPPFSVALGTLSSTDGPMRELLGVWLVPIGVLGGVFCLVVTTLFARSLIRVFALSRLRSQGT